jgi:hypothetical protein
MKKYDKPVKIEVCETVSDNELHTSLAYHLQKILQNTITRITSSLRRFPSRIAASNFASGLQILAFDSASRSSRPAIDASIYYVF